MQSQNIKNNIAECMISKIKNSISALHGNRCNWFHFSFFVDTGSSCTQPILNKHEYFTCHFKKLGFASRCSHTLVTM